MEGVSIGNNVDLRGNEELASTSDWFVLSIDEESSPSSGRLGNRGSVKVLAHGRQDGRDKVVSLESRSGEESEVSLNGSRGSSLPQSDGGGSSLDDLELDGCGVIGIGQLVLVGGSLHVANDLVDEGSGGVGNVVEWLRESRSGIDGTVVSVGDGDEMLLSDEFVEEEFWLIGDKELILGSNDDQLGHLDESVVVNGIFDISDGLEGGINGSSSNSIVDVISKGKSPVAVASED